MSTSIGARIAAERKLAGLTQDQLARKITYSVSLLRAVERGDRPASPGFTAAVAAAIGIEPEQLTGAPYRDTLDRDGVLEGLSELRVLLTEGTVAAGMDPQASIQELMGEVIELDLMCRDGRSRDALARLHVLVRRLLGALHDANVDQRGRVFDTLAMAWIVGTRLCERLGFLALATPALDRLEWAAAHANDELYASQAHVRRSRVLAQYGATDAALRAATTGIELIGGRDDQAANVARGHAHLCAATVASRALQRDTARMHIEEARRAAGHVTAVESDLYGTRFGATSVEINACSVELDAGDPYAAARDGLALRLPEQIAPARAAYHWYDTARACLLIGSAGEALTALNKARAVAPQQTRLHPGVRETLAGIATAERRRSASLASFASWVGMPL